MTIYGSPLPPVHFGHFRGPHKTGCGHRDKIDEKGVFIRQVIQTLHLTTSTSPRPPHHLHPLSRLLVPAFFASVLSLSSCVHLRAFLSDDDVGDKFEVPKKVAAMSALIQAMIDDENADDDGDEQGRDDGARLDWKARFTGEAELP